jgi:chromosomal replication initiation ATPase DnaA
MKDITKEGVKMRKPFYINDETVIPGIEIAVGYITGVKAEDIKKKTRQRDIVEARQIVMTLAYESKLLSQHFISKYYGKVDHCPVRNAIKRINGFYDTDKSFKAKIDKLREMLKNKNEITHTWEVFNEVKSFL